MERMREPPLWCAYASAVGTFPRGWPLNCRPRTVGAELPAFGRKGWLPDGRAGLLTEVEASLALGLGAFWGKCLPPLPSLTDLDADFLAVGDKGLLKVPAIDALFL